MSVDNALTATAVDKRRLWSLESERKLEELLSNYTIDQVAEKLHRTRIAIIVKSKKLGISRNVRDGWYTEQEVASILGMDPKSVRRRILAGSLVAVPHNSDKLPRKGKSAPWHISKENLVRYIRRCPEDLQGRDVDMVLIVDILVGIKTNIPEVR